jgi:hypothetical protein
VAEVVGVTAQNAGAIHQLFLARRFRKEIDLAISLDPRDVQAQRDLLEFYLLAPGIAGGDQRQAAATAQKIAEVDAAEGFLARARIAEVRKDVKEREAMMRKAVDAQPPSYRARILPAQFYVAHANKTAAQEHAQAALKLDAGRVDAYAILAAIEAGRGDWTALEATLAAAARAERYVQVYLAQEPEGNEPTGRPGGPHHK